MLGSIPVVPVSARKRTGLDVLMHAVVHHYEEGPQGTVVKYTPRRSILYAVHSEYRFKYIFFTHTLRQSAAHIEDIPYQVIAN